MKIQSVAIVGGGTAGWLAANHLAKALFNQNITITLIESPDIPTIGVGEGTVPTIRKTLQSFGISETEFITRCDVTFKQSIKFQNWLDSHRHGRDNFYHHLFDPPSSMGDDLSSLWLQNPSDAYSQLVSSQFDVCEANLAPKLITTPEYQAVQGYAYHLNAAKFALLLAENAKQKFAVNHVKANVIDTRLHLDGSIASLVLDKCGEQEFDFYIDCSGFDSILLAKALKVPFVDKSQELFVNKAVVVQVPTDPDAIIPPYTKATAHQAGWIWDIALSNRRGVGLVYSSAHLDDEQAEQKLNRYLSGQLDQYSYRTIPMKVGYRKQFWAKNCVALGLAQGFLEPIEATSIMLTDFAAGYLASRFPSDSSQCESLSERFNQTMSYAWERVVEFAKMHYCLSDRHDSDFWIDNRDPQTIPAGLSNKLALWQEYVPLSEDLFSKFEVFNVENYLYVLYGMKFLTYKKTMSESSLVLAKQHAARIRRHSEQLCQHLPAHRELLSKIHQYGLQKI
ncbi:MULTISPECIES: tryptophan halogenase family protein [Shewanella]|uniref:tryptophan halogenase family protein n=1 Tax=Shewanella TaxID=22 RepID=UPI000C41531A|nr:MULTISPECIES: tryptophan halogenase family protein [Shewanella]NCQ44584.1 tryptophan 7-halogenase [Shewanella frigidimarina]MBB1389979.1 tryptophan 7-halogenase [Shewanella sp. SG44-6]NCO72247.1 tryptophan 7-halogenase [Shewanella vesiculosa]NCP35927.1 tryptophan 7-halogenase [Shewanella vesiculosa]NCP68686.1 tryptophan 7-halogenase [Shewanella vesiculosa]